VATSVIYEHIDKTVIKQS